ncbi:TetR family transcriptional regulator [Mycobacterium intermedium]|uniref:TetR family transcriptional regulator n=1 Tax=Mycobacterium intermedium TaxID=28445 RepID=A0A1E3SD94_MYCIE|nr:TetR/AcrR family transcriptional regulator [Mycobacterium intermedium]MCV6965144.1 TetR/AcrR family transcriptional regulator [Mycobacterium intermedium]ODR00127.1 TetR family transcriptional regulator [Mycobacterium intermedium]OPE48033.1 TetR family transcriptional regulator [Mycobacterium intermedium]ORA99478.1 TetR family transcriptional regulator [Mycobacterium intermedium]
MVDVSTEGIRRSRARRGSGDLLRQQILDAATELLLETGQAKAVSIRSVAQRVGVTPPSIYLHFEDKESLLDAVCARFLDRLDEAMEQAAIGQPPTVDVLRAQGMAYVRFALQTPELYRLATMGEFRSGRHVDIALHSSAFKHMRASVQTLMDQGVYRSDDATTIALELWCVSHGIAAMFISKPHLPFGDVEAFADRVFGAVICGHMVAGLVGTGATFRELTDWALAHQSCHSPSEERPA